MNATFSDGSQYFRRASFTMLMVLCFVSGMFNASTARAAIALQIDDGFNPVITVNDGVLPDMNPLPGAITFSGSDGIWSFVLESGTGTLLNGNAVKLTSQNIASSGAGTLTVDFSENGILGVYPSTLSLGIVQLFGASITVSTYVSNTNALFATDVLIGTLTQNSLGAISQNYPVPTPFLPVPFLNTTGYSVTHRVVVASTSGANTTGDLQLTLSPSGIGNPAPEPASMAIWGLGALGLAVAGMRRKKLVG